MTERRCVHLPIRDLLDVDRGRWLVIDGYEDEPAAFGVPPFIGFHVRYICGVLAEHGCDVTYVTIDALRPIEGGSPFFGYDGIVVLAGAVVPGKYLRGTPISRKETEKVLRLAPRASEVLLGGWAIRMWRQSGWTPLRPRSFMALHDVDATLDVFLSQGVWQHARRTPEQWRRWSHLGAGSPAVSNHPDLNGPLTFEVEVYQGCVRYKRGCRFCIEPKKGVPKWREVDDILGEVRIALDAGVRHVRLGGMTDVYTYRAEGVVEMEYPRPDPEPIAALLHGLREDERLDVLHVDNANPSIMAEHPEEAELITRTLVDTLSDGAVLSFGIESADPDVHERNWLNCDPSQLKTAIRMVNRYGRERGPRGLPKLLPGLNFIAGLNGENEGTYRRNLDLLGELMDEDLWLRRINLRQVEGTGFQDVDKSAFAEFKDRVRSDVDGPLLERMFPIGTVLKQVHWESHDDRIRRPSDLSSSARDPGIHGEPGVTFGRQIGAYPILIGVPYRIPLETQGDIIVTDHGARSITGVEMALDPSTATEAQFRSVPGIGRKTAWGLISARARLARRGFESISIEMLYEEWVDSPPTSLTSCSRRRVVEPIESEAR